MEREASLTGALSRLLLLVFLVVGVAAMHTFGHLDNRHEATPHATTGALHPEGAHPTRPDAGPIRPQADPGRPDVDSSHPDAGPGHPQANPGHPDADPGRADADPGRADADPGHAPGGAPGTVSICLAIIAALLALAPLRMRLADPFDAWLRPGAGRRAPPALAGTPPLSLTLTRTVVLRT
ncbi:hypothetical protein [Nonomuraea sp. NPDC003804]|uniref:hypothetical protein n=1 Tax=Nonomuraea sp. NPDC003804 TaxID=3154547 RepID=UPI0033B8BD85